MPFIKQVNLPEFEIIEQEIRVSHKFPGDTFVTWKKLHDDLKAASSESDKKFRWTYFRLYTELSWQLISEFDRSEFVSIAISRQVAMALLLDFDIWKKMIWTIATRSEDIKDVGLFYSEIRTAFFESPAFVGKWKDKDVTVKDLVDDLRRIKRADTTSLEVAETMGKIKESFFPKNDVIADRYASAKPSELVEQFVGLYDFFTEYEPDRIWNVVQAYINPSFIDNTAAFIEKNEKALEDLDNGVVSIVRPEPAEPAFVSQPTKSNKKPTYLEIRMIAERKFEKDASGDFNDPEEVMNMLNEWATKYNDEKISELFIFNEQTGSFEWNNQLLTS